MSEKVIVYKKPACVQCTAVLRALDAADVKYDLVDMTQDEAAYKMVTEELGYRQVPVVVFHDIHFAGFMPSRVNEVIQAFRAAEASPAMAV